MGVIENIAVVSEENVAAVEEVGATTEELNHQVDGVSDAARALSEMAQASQQLVSRFKLPESRSEQASPKSFTEEPEMKRAPATETAPDNGHYHPGE